MINVLNKATGEIIKVDLICKYENDVLAARKFNPEPGTKFYSTYPFIIKTDDTIEVDGASKPCRVVTLADGYEVKTGRTKREKPVPVEPVPTEPVEPAEKPVAYEPVEATESPVEPTPTPTPAPAPTLDAATQAFAALTPLFSGVQTNVEAAVMAKLEPVINQLKQQAKTQTKRLEIITSSGERSEVDGVFCDDFEDILQDVADGFYPYLWGAAGCGKTHTAEQVAKALKLDFYCQTTIQFAHDVKGYGDAAGNFVETSFYKAFKYGGLYFQDEYDRSSSEAAVVLNTALANGYYDFPVVGRVEAHPNFRFMAAGNTRMMGADDEYVSGQVIDASSRDRVIYYEMKYDRRVELPVMANGDVELVDFVEDVRQAIEECRISHVVSYRATKYMAARSTNKEKTLVRSTFKGIENDMIRTIYGALKDKENQWAKAMKNIIK